MKTLLTACSVLVWVITSTAADLKVATADLQLVMEGYYKSQEVARQLKDKRVSFLEELKGLKLEGQKLSTQAEELRDRAGTQAFSASEREKSKQEFELKVVELRQFEVRYDDFRAQREAELQAAAATAQRRIVEEVTAATRAIGEQEGLNLILNSNKANLLSSDVLYAKGVDDVTAKILARLNAGQRAPETPAKKSGD